MTTAPPATSTRPSARRTTAAGELEAPRRHAAGAHEAAAPRKEELGARVAAAEVRRARAADDEHAPVAERHGGVLVPRQGHRPDAPEAAAARREDLPSGARARPRTRRRRAPGRRRGGTPHARSRGRHRAGRTEAPARRVVELDARQRPAAAHAAGHQHAPVAQRRRGEAARAPHRARTREAAGARVVELRRGERPAALAVQPPTTSTRPSRRRTASWPTRGVNGAPVAGEGPARGSKSSALGSPPPMPPTRRTRAVGEQRGGGAARGAVIEPAGDTPSPASPRARERRSRRARRPYTAPGGRVPGGR